LNSSKLFIFWKKDWKRDGKSECVEGEGGGEGEGEGGGEGEGEGARETEKYRARERESVQEREREGDTARSIKRADEGASERDPWQIIYCEHV
jgi:hypothetical protein